MLHANSASEKIATLVPQGLPVKLLKPPTRNAQIRYKKVMFPHVFLCFPWSLGEIFVLIDKSGGVEL